MNRTDDSGSNWQFLAVSAAVAALLATAVPVQAYIGPGAGFAVVSSFFVILLTAFVSIFSFLLWPFRAVWLSWKRRRNLAGRKVGRVIVVGLDGMDPVLAEKYMAEGILPNFSKLTRLGEIRRFLQGSCCWGLDQAGRGTCLSGSVAYCSGVKRAATSASPWASR